jgi:hypothetical protein
MIKSNMTRNFRIFLKQTILLGMLLSGISVDAAASSKLRVYDDTDGIERDNNGRIKVAGQTLYINEIDPATGDIIKLSGSTNIGGLLDVAGTATGNNWHHFLGDKYLNEGIRTSADGGTKILTINFANARGASPIYYKGASIVLKCIITGEVLGSFKEYICDLTLYATPKSGTTTKVLEQIYFDVTTDSGAGFLIPSTPSTSDTIHDIYLNSGTTVIDNQAVVIFYDVVSDNVTSVS